MVKGCLVFIASIVAGLGISFAITLMVRAVTGDNDLGSAIGAGVGLLAFLTTLVYASLWLSDADEIANPPKPETTLERWRAAKQESKLQGAELRIGLVFAVIGGATAATANASNLATAVVTSCCAIVGGLIGFDVKRRVRHIREQFASHN